MIIRLAILSLYFTLTFMGAVWADAAADCPQDCPPPAAAPLTPPLTPEEHEALQKEIEVLRIQLEASQKNREEARKELEWHRQNIIRIDPFIRAITGKSSQDHPLPLEDP